MRFNLQSYYQSVANGRCCVYTETELKYDTNNTETVNAGESSWCSKYILKSNSAFVKVTH